MSEWTAFDQIATSLTAIAAILGVHLGLSLLDRYRGWRWGRRVNVAHPGKDR